MSALTIADAYQLMHEGSVALAQIEANGIRIDTDYLDYQIVKSEKKIRRLESELRDDELFTTWRKEFGEKAKLGSGEQLGHILFNVLKIPYQTHFTASGRYRTDRAILEGVDLPFVQKYLKLENLRKDKSTFLEGIRNETIDGFLHPFFHLASGDDDKGGARSMRGSSSSPNFQNFPNRDKDRAAVIRKAFIPRSKDHQLGEVDFKAAEVTVAAVVTKDPKLLEYVSDQRKDMHRDMAMRLFFLDAKQAKIKNIRNNAKACFVFAQFYGDFYPNCAKNMWGHIRKDKLTLEDGTPLDKHLKKHGIKRLGDCDPEQLPRPGTFEKHVKDEEKYFWYEMFPVYTQWKKAYYNRYLENGYFTYSTGFRIEGEYTRNQVLNYPIQGPSFHCLLWTIIRLQRWLVKNKMKTKIVGQIHDSIVIDFHKDEIQDVLFKVQELVRVKLPKAWDWVIVPLTVEMEVAPLGATWWDKKPWVESNGVWGPEKD